MLNLKFLPLILLLFPSMCFGYELLAPGGRARAMGGAFVGVSDDWSAIYWNPGGLFQLLDKEIGIDTGYLSIRLLDEDSISNEKGIFKRYVDGEVGSFNHNTIDQSIHSPSIGIVVPGKGIGFGFGVFKRMAHDLEWKDRVGELEAHIRRRLNIYSAAFSFSTHIAPVVFMGAGLNLLHGEHELSASKEYPSYKFNYRLGNGYGTGLEVSVGLLYQPLQKFSMGAVYRGGGVVDIKGEASATCNPLYVEERSNYTKRIHLPPTYGLGLVSRHIPKITIAFDWSKTGWETWRNDYRFEKEGPTLLKNPKWDELYPGWYGADRWGIGIEIRPNPRWGLMFGGFYSGSQLPEGQVDLVNGTVEMDRFGYSGGVGYKVGGFEFEISHQSSSGSSKIHDTSYQKDVSIYGVSFKVQFF